MPHKAEHSERRNTGADFVRNACCAMMATILISLNLDYFNRGDEWGIITALSVIPSCFNPLLLSTWFKLVGFYQLFSCMDKFVTKQRPIYLIPAGLFAFFTIEGIHFENAGKVDFFNQERFFVLLCLLACLGYLILYYCLFNLADAFVERHALKLFGKDDVQGFLGTLLSVYDHHTFIASFVLLVILTLPLLVLHYPAMFMGDTFHQIAQIMHVSGYKEILVQDGGRQFTNQHPILHTLLIRTCLHLGYVFFQSDNVGIFIYALVQMTILYLSLSYCAHVFVHHLNVKPLVVICLIIGFSLHPRLHQYTILVTKDVIFTALLMLVLCKSFLIMRIERGKATWRDLLPWALISIVAVLFRRDALYIIVPFFICMLLVSAARKRVALVLVVLMATFMVWSRLITPAIGVAPGSRRSLFSLPFQQTARCLSEHPDDVTDEEAKVLRRIFTDNDLARIYSPSVADPVLHAFNEECTNEDIEDYLHVWLQMLRRHPATCIRATLENKYEYFYPSIHVGYSYDYLSGNQIARINRRLGTEFSRIESLSQLRLAVTYVVAAVFSLPIFNYVVSTFSYILVLVFIIFYALRKRVLIPIIVMIMPIMQIAILIAGPMNGSYFRYTYPIAMIIPILMLIAINPTTND